MPVLTKQKWELFCQQIASRVDPPQAYKNAGFTARTQDSARNSANKLLRSDAIKRRIEELSKQNEANAQAANYIVGEVHERKYRIAVMGEIVAKLLLRFRTRKKLSVSELKEIREYLKQSAIETGQWSEKQDLTIRPGAPAEDLSRVPLETLLVAREKLLEADRMLTTIEAAPGSVETVAPQSGEDRGAEEAEVKEESGPEVETSVESWSAD